MEGTDALISKETLNLVKEFISLHGYETRERTKAAGERPLSLQFSSHSIREDKDTPAALLAVGLSTVFYPCDDDVGFIEFHSTIHKVFGVFVDTTTAYDQWSKISVAWSVVDDVDCWSGPS